ncbi:MAG TPA: nitrate ABC transporter, permease protein [Cyanobacteria bacterium UBA11149]|nr:nitrate ABC transporter, permease protein [Cyanobacteria bacterium UBA11367]HBE57169.1 nitrate ABC transporter, permease protein [Cyanobacteria bacterium UBA11366]HBK66177.1 nitrate ABC transporter, permease protein [Cyanobacteria bacterium UBA11166]HBR73673.1 nitrate ABC transporter, permease protein [Cyanobacteria bacterium UBA11159]HBS71456.1 nitrate ABC transporter, permease protein [Cyanobacteria bacterium UBA11153]HBW89160.1 nitrate ABC transporter, permease protein [Cyanobacteria bac
MTVAQRRLNNGSQNALIANLQKQLPNLIAPLVALAILLTIWQLLSMSGITKLPGPLSIFTVPRTRELLFYPFFDRGGLDKGLFWQTLASLKRVAIGYSAAAIVGIGMGILVGTNPIIDKALDPIFQFLRMVAPLAWVPIALAALQKNEPAALFVIFVTSVWPILINTTVGVKQIPQDYNNVAKVLQLSKQEYFFNILIPSALPYIFTGLRIAIGLAWLAIIAAEIVMSGIVGIGFFIWDAYQNNYVSEIILALVYIGAVGLLLDKGMAWLQTKIVPGDPK